MKVRTCMYYTMMDRREGLKLMTSSDLFYVMYVQDLITLFYQGNIA